LDIIVQHYTLFLLSFHFFTWQILKVSYVPTSWMPLGWHRVEHNMWSGNNFLCETDMTDRQTNIQRCNGWSLVECVLTFDVAEDVRTEERHEKYRDWQSAVRKKLPLTGIEKWSATRKKNEFDQSLYVDSKLAMKGWHRLMAKGYQEWNKQIHYALFGYIITKCANKLIRL
jgi:hypothetical protein